MGAADLALERVNEVVAHLRERTEEARSDATARVEESRARLTKLPEDLPAQWGELVRRGEAALERLRSQPGQSS